MKPRVRFAPSPTGDLHIGSVRTALYNFLFARHEGGTFILRIEDTDQRRNKEESLRTITEGMRWCGLAWDEGPYFQSERLEFYRRYAKQLEDAGRAYWQEDPEKGRALYFRIDREKISWDDTVHGGSAMDCSADKDFVIVKSDGFPTYHFGVVIDDHEMGITHIFRGDEHFPNTPKQIMLYRAFGWDPPRFGHMPIIFDPAGAKLSKRKIDEYRKIGLPVTVEECRAIGYLPEAVVNFVALLGWSPGDNTELMTLDEMVAKFTADRIGNTPARFLVDKLQWMNGQYIRKLPLDRLVSLCRPYLESAYDLASVPEETVREAIRQQQERLRMLSEIAGLLRFCLAPTIEMQDKPFQKHLKAPHAGAVLSELKAGLAAMPAFDKDPVETLLKGIAERRGLKLGQVAQPLRVAVTGTDQSPPIHETLTVVGKDRALARIEAALARI